MFFQPTEKTAFNGSELEQIERGHFNTGQNLSDYFAGTDLHFYYSNCPCLPTLFGGWLAEMRILNQFEFLIQSVSRVRLLVYSVID